MRKFLFFIISLSVSLGLKAADTLSVSSFRHVGLVVASKPYMLDSVNVKGETFGSKDVLDSFIDLQLVSLSSGCGRTDALSVEEGLHLAGFSVSSMSYLKLYCKVGGLENFKLFVDGKEQKDEKLKLEPGTHEFSLKYLVTPEDSLSGAPSVKLYSEQEYSVPEEDSQIYSLDLNTMGESCGGMSLSPSGRYVSVGHTVTKSDGKTSSYFELTDRKNGRVIARQDKDWQWLPQLPSDLRRVVWSRDDEYYITRPSVSGRELIAVNPESGLERLVASDIPEGHFTIVPGGRYLVYSLQQEGPKEGAVHQILTPDDRQPGWRNRGYLARYDIENAVMQQLTFGFHNVSLSDVSADGSHILFMTSRERLTKRPTTLFSVFRMNLETMECECLIEDDGFINEVSFSPDGKQILVVGSADAFDGVGRDVLEGQIPNTFDFQLFALNCSDRKVRPLTKGFAPSVEKAEWWGCDGQIYALCEDKDCRNLYSINPETLKSKRLPNKEEYLYSFSLAEGSPVMAYYGQSLCNGDRAYVMDVSSLSQKCLADFSASRLKDVRLGEGGAFEFTSSRGDLINGFYVLPPDFDPSRKYPMLVHYYGGCSPSSRYCTGSYSPQYYAAQGYVFYVINPSGAAGFGQEFAARHVNTAGNVVSDDIIEGVQAFCKAHEFVDTAHIGCFSASYGGFMTQLLLSKTDMFATGISHAGISDHTSYWGEGYWGYSYSETSMADSYPWNRKDLYVDRSPLYNADKIHTPLLFLHGSADTNVPIGESIQMFTALKLLGCETAFVVVDGENHGIREFEKRRQWLRTISAWFAKYLKEDSLWWDELYPEKNL